MDSLLCKTSPAEIQNEPMSLSVDSQGLCSSETIFSEQILALSEKDLQINVTEDKNEGMNDYNVPKTFSDCDSPKVPDSAIQKTISPTLIGSAIKVMKSFFSPDKTKSKSASVLSPINHPNSGSGSPRSSIFISGKTELFSSEPEPEIYNNFPSLPEVNLKNSSPINELGPIQNPLPLDPFNSTDDSFLTTVSFTEDSFHSAVTHLDEHGDTLKNGVKLMDKILSNSQNLDVLDSYNDSFEINETCLENTTLRNVSLTSVRTKLTNTSVQSLESLNSNQFNDENHSDNIPVITAQNEILEKNVGDSVIRDKHLSNLITKNDGEAGYQGDETSIKTLTSQIDSGKNNLNKNIEMANLFLSKSFQIKPSSKPSEICENGLNLNMVGEEKEQNNDLIYKLRAKENDTDFEGLSDEQDGYVENCISTTTVVLGTVDSVDLENMLMSLKADGSETNTSSRTSVDYDERTCSAGNESSKKLAVCNRQTSENCSVSAKDFFPVMEEKRSCISEGNSPNNKTENTKIKLNKSDELISCRVLNEALDKKRTLMEKKSSVDILLMRNSEASEMPKASHNVNSKVIQKSAEQNQPEICKTVMKVNSNKPDSVPVISQQSYTILSTHNNSLKRPVIEPLNISGHSLEKQTFQINVSDVSHQLKKSPPFADEHSQTSQKKISLLYSPESCNDKEVDVVGKPTRIFSTNETLSSVNLSNKGNIPLSVSAESETGENHNGPSNSKNLSMGDPEKEVQSPGKKIEMIVPTNELSESLLMGHKMNQTFEENSPKYNSQTHTLNNELGSEPKLNLTNEKTCDSSKTNKSFTKKLESPEIDQSKKTDNKELNQIVNKKAESFEVPTTRHEPKEPELCSPNTTTQEGNKVLEIPACDKNNETFVREDFGNTSMTKQVKEMHGTSENMKVINPPVCGVTPELDSGICIKEVGGNYQESNLENRSLESCRNNLKDDFSSKDMSESFFSTKSSDTSLACSDLSAMLNNEEELRENRSIDDLSGKFGEMNLNESLKQVVEGNKMLFQNDTQLTDFVVENNMQAEEKLLESFKDEKLTCDSELVQLIQEQFSPKDIERICSVVHDMSSIKLSNDILRASEEFDKSFHEKLSSTEQKSSENEVTPCPLVSILSPPSLDFLNSIRGKPTGRDLSRESLYVKFDPLVQPNSLIDFTKEAEAIAPDETSPPDPHSSSICEQLLTISPEKKPNDIVPPLTPLSHKVESGVNDDKVEKLKELQNEIYFLKNLYAERERINKTKMDDYESQITHLTGVNCMLEDKLKESNERQKSLVKKLKEHTQNTAHLKVIMEEYVKVISKLSEQLKTIESENLKQVEALSLEKDSYMTHLQNTEAAFSDVHTKYEKSKKTIMSLRTNEAMYKNTIAEQGQKLEDLKLKAKEAQEHALLGYKKLQEELNETKANHTQETARLRAQLRKTELKVEALQESLDQKVKENQQLTAICDELIEGKK